MGRLGEHGHRAEPALQTGLRLLRQDRLGEVEEREGLEGRRRAKFSTKGRGQQKRECCRVGTKLSKTGTILGICTHCIPTPGKSLNRWEHIHKTTSLDFPIAVNMIDLKTLRTPLLRLQPPILHL